MTVPTPQLRHYRSDLLTGHFVFTGGMGPFGPLMTYLNDTNRNTVHLKNVDAVALDAGNVMDTFHTEDLIVSRDEIMAIRLAEQVSGGTVQLLARREKLLI